MCSGKRQWWADGYPTEEDENLLNNETNDVGKENDENKLPKKIEPISDQ